MQPFLLQHTHLRFADVGRERGEAGERLRVGDGEDAQGETADGS